MSSSNAPWFSRSSAIGLPSNNMKKNESLRRTTAVNYEKDDAITSRDIFLCEIGDETNRFAAIRIGATCNNACGMLDAA